MSNDTEDYNGSRDKRASIQSCDSSSKKQPALSVDDKLKAASSPKKDSIIDDMAEKFDDNLNLGISDKASSSNAFSTNNEPDLRAIVSSIDIFSNKKPRPVKSNKSYLPDLTMSNPPPPPEEVLPVKENLNSLSAVNKSIIETDLFGDISFGKDTSIFVAEETLKNVETSSNSMKSAPKQNSDNFFDLLDGNNIGETVDIDASCNNIVDPTNHVTNNNNKCEIDLFSDDILGYSPPPITHSGITAANNVVCNADIPLPIQPTSQSSDASSDSNKGASENLPETWASLGIGAKINIDLDNLLKPQNSKNVAPTMNQLAMGRKANSSFRS